MSDPAALRPLEEAAEEIRRLEEYGSPDELAAAIPAVVAAIERSLRLRLRNDPEAPDPDRLSALSSELSLDDVIRSLRARDRLSLETAGSVHEARGAADRIAGGEAASAADADRVRTAVERLRRELADPLHPPGEAAAAPPGPEVDETGAPENEAGTGKGREAVVSGSDRWMAWLATAVAVFVVAAAAWVVARGGDRDYDDARAVFRAGRMDSAAAMFERLLDDRPSDVSVMLYLARSYRRTDRPREAADVLRTAVDRAPSDPDVRRELGHLFMDLGQTRSAVSQYERALEHDPDESLNWAALIRALREMADPRADELLRDAPPDVQAALGSG